MKNIVLVPGVVPWPCARRWISVVLAVCHRCPSELWLSSLYSASLPVSGLNALPCMAAPHKSGLDAVAWWALCHGDHHGLPMECVTHVGTVLGLTGGVQLVVLTVTSSAVHVGSRGGTTLSDGQVGGSTAGCRLPSVSTLSDGRVGGSVSGCMVPSVPGAPTLNAGGGGGLVLFVPIRGSKSFLVVPWRMRINWLSVSTWLATIGASGEVGAGYRKAVAMS